MLGKRFLISINVSIGAYKEFLEQIALLGKEKKSSYVCIANVHMLIEAYNDKEFAQVVNDADIVSPDGMPLATGIRKLYNINQDRVAGMDVLPDMLSMCENNGTPVFFYGGTQDMIDQTRKYIELNYSNLKIAGMISPPFRPLQEHEEEDIVKKINESNAGIVFVALGCPKQERWMASMKGRVDACMLGIGGALPVMIGMQKRASKWMQRNHLEWLFRLFQEPKRLFKRYLTTNSLFMILFYKRYFEKRFKHM